MNAWISYLLVFTVFSFFYVWYRYALLFAGDIKLNKNYRAKMSIIVPFFNEKYKIISKTIKSLHDAIGEKEIIVVDDGSTSDKTFLKLKELQKSIPFTLERYKENKGKRHAQVIGFKKSKNPIIVTIDSDTTIKKDALIKLINYFADEKVGAVTGNIKLKNEKKNFLTKMIAVTYWVGLNINKRGQSNFDIVTCCSGCLSAYRKKIIKPLYEVYLNQKFLGKRCTYGDDRHLTNLILKQGHKTKYAIDSISYTITPSTYKSFLTQQLRWKKSFMRESVIGLSYSFPRNKLLFFDFLITLVITLMCVGVRVMTIYFLFQSFIFLHFSYIPYLLFTVIVFAGTKNSLLFLEKPKKAFYILPFALFYDFVLYWLNFYAIFTLRQTKWGTRE